MPKITATLVAIEVMPLALGKSRGRIRAGIKPYFDGPKNELCKPSKNMAARPITTLPFRKASRANNATKTSSDLTPRTMTRIPKRSVRRPAKPERKMKGMVKPYAAHAWPPGPSSPPQIPPAANAKESVLFKMLSFNAVRNWTTVNPRKPGCSTPRFGGCSDEGSTSSTSGGYVGNGIQCHRPRPPGHEKSPAKRGLKVRMRGLEPPRDFTPTRT